MKKIGVFLGRFSPLHLGHEAVIKQMIEICGIENCLIILGSSNSSISFRHLFSYVERRSFLKKRFPDIRVVGLADYDNNAEWLMALDDILSLVDINPEEVTFFGGCEEDVYFFIEANRRCHLVNRFAGETPKISATEVRDSLVHDRELEGLLSPVILEDVKRVFSLKWERLRKM